MDLISIFDDIPLTEELTNLLQNSGELIATASPGSQENSSSSPYFDQQIVVSETSPPPEAQKRKLQCILDKKPGDLVVKDLIIGCYKCCDRQRRESNKNSEKRRRDRLNEQIKELQGILFPEGGKQQKLTKEDILEKAIYQLRHRQMFDKAEACEAKRIKVITSTPTQDVPVSEIEVGLTMLLKQTYKSMKRNKYPFLTAFHQMEELAAKANNPQLTLYLHGIAGIYNAYVAFYPPGVEYHSNQCLQLYYATQMKQKKANQKLQPVLLNEDGSDLGTVNLIMRAVMQAATGQISKSLETWKEASMLAKALNHAMTNVYLIVERIILHYHIGRDLTTGTFEELQTSSSLPCFGTLGFGFLQLFQATSKAQKLAALETVEAGVKEYESVFKEYAELSFGAFLLVACYKSEEYDKGLEYADKLLGRLIVNGIEGYYGKSEFLRLKAELLFKKHKEIGLDPDSIEAIESTFRSAIEESAAKGAVVPHLRALLSLARFYQEVGSQTQKEEIKSELKIRCDTAPKELSDLKTAQEMLEQLSL